MGEALAETAFEEVAQRLAFRVGAASSAGASRLKRTISRSSERCDGRTRFRRWAKKPLAPRLLYSSPLRSHDTAKDMSESRVATPSSPKSRTRFGYVRSLCTRNPVSSATAPSGPSTSTVLVWPPRRPSCSKRCTRCGGSAGGGRQTRDARPDHRDVLHVLMDITTQAFVKHLSMTIH